MVLSFQAERAHEPIWLAMDRAQHATHEVAQLSDGAFKAMRHAAR